MFREVMVASCLVLVAPAAMAEGPSWKPDAAVYFVQPKDGDVIAGPVKVVMGLSNAGIAPAGIEKASTGHHHLLVNRALPPKDELQYGLPADESTIHFGGGQTETTLKLPPGKHTLQLLLGDYSHIPHDPPIASKVITITVK